MAEKNISSNPEKEENVKIYDNDDAYMLNDDKDEKENAFMYDDQEEGQEVHHNQYNENEDQLGDNENQNENENEMNYNDNDNYFDNYNNEEVKDYPEGNIDRQIHSENEEDTVRNKIDSLPPSEKERGNETSNQKVNNSVQKIPTSQKDSKQIQLITLKYISVCQCCKENFNSSTNMPYLLKCGHFFCRKCLEDYFTDENGISCPNDGLVAGSLMELKLLSNLIMDKIVDSTDRGTRQEGYCDMHKNQKLSHYIEDTREVICVYCAFNKFKKNPKYDIKEIKDKCKEIIADVDKILENNQHNVELLQVALKDIKANKESEEETVNALYEPFVNSLIEKKKEILVNIDNLFTSNACMLSEKLDFFSNKIENAEILKTSVNALMNNETYQVNETLDKFNQFIREESDQSKLSMELQEFRFSHDDENKLFKYLNNFGDLKTKAKYLRFSSHRDMPRDYEPNRSENNRIDSLDYPMKKFNIGSGSSGVIVKKGFEGKYIAQKKSNLNDIINTSDMFSNENPGKALSQNKNILFSGDEFPDAELSMGSSSNKNTNLKMNRGDAGVINKYTYNRNTGSGFSGDFGFDQNKRERDFNLGVSPINSSKNIKK